jgi:hypothetical protein
MQELFWRGLPMVPLPLPLLNMICTNVPGSPSALYSVGRRLLASYPQVPTGYELGLGVAVQSYDGKLCFGVTADAHVAPDAGRLRDYIRICFQELTKAAGVKNAASRHATPRTAKPRPASGTEPAKAAGKVEAVFAAAAVSEAPAPGERALDRRQPREAPREEAVVPAEPVERSQSLRGHMVSATVPPEQVSRSQTERAPREEGVVQPEPVERNQIRRAPREEAVAQPEPVLV